MSPVEPYLGYCAGEPMIVRTMPRHVPRWFRPKAHVFLGTMACGALMLGALSVSFVQFAQQNAYGIEWRQYPVPEECKPLAKQMGLPRMLTTDEALMALLKIEKIRNQPGVAVCLDAVHKSWRLK